ncbi:MAG: hypothetical protein ACK550_09040, partial [Synechococcaceae cyanobacterium]
MSEVLQLPRPLPASGAPSPQHQEPAIAVETLDLLEWPRLAAHVAQFASTATGQCHCQRLPLASSAAASREWLAETAELLGLDGLLEGGLSFQGCHDISTTVPLCAKGGCAGGEAVLPVAPALAPERRVRALTAHHRLRPACRAKLPDL